MDMTKDDSSAAIKAGIVAFKAERMALERRLKQVIAAELAAFTELTGATVSEVDVAIVSVTCIGTPADRFISAVRVATPLD